MASLNISLTLTHDNKQKIKETIAETTAGNIFDHQRVVIGTSETQITIITGIGNANWVFLKNLDVANYVEVGFATTVYNMKLTANASASYSQFAFFPITPGATTLYLKANTNPVDVEYFCIER